MIVQGNPDLVQQPLVFGRDAATGPFYQLSWKGTEEACNAAFNEIVGADHYEISGDGAVYTLTARFSSNPYETTTGVPVHEERLHCNKITKSIYEHPNFAGIATETKNDIRRYIDQQVELPFDITVPAEVSLLNLLKAGVDSFVIYQAVVVTTDTAPISYPWVIGFDGVGSIETTAQMLDDAGLVSGWASNLPDSDGPPDGFIYGWLKGPPEITTVGGNRSQLVQEWEFGLWSTAIYSRP